MELKNINCTRLLFNPKDEDFQDRMIKRSGVFDIPGKHRKEILTYIILCYDMNSEIRRNIREYLQRKVEAAQIAGFHITKGIFSKYFENILVGEDDDVNKAIIEYVYLNFNNDYKLLYLLEEKYNQAIKEHSTTVKVFNEKDRQHLTNMKEQIEEIEDILFGGKELLNARKALYAGTESARLRIRAEDRVENMESGNMEIWNPYPGYVTSKLKFVGDRVPSE